MTDIPGAHFKDLHGRCLPDCPACVKHERRLDSIQIGQLQGQVAKLEAALAEARKDLRESATGRWHTQAGEKIEKLREENARLREAADEFAGVVLDFNYYGDAPFSILSAAARKMRKALEETDAQ